MYLLAFCSVFAHHPSFALFFISNNSSWFLTLVACFFLIASRRIHFIPNVSPLLPSNLSFIQALSLFLLAFPSTFSGTMLQTLELLRSNDNAKESEDRLWGRNKNKLNQASKLIVINTATSGKGNSHFPS